MNAEFFEAIEDIEKEKGIPRNYMYDKIRQAMLTAFRRDNPECEDNVEVIVDEDKNIVDVVFPHDSVELDAVKIRELGHGDIPMALEFFDQMGVMLSSRSFVRMGMNVIDSSSP